MKEDIMLVVPNKEHEKQAINLIDEVDKRDLDPNIRFSGFNSLENYRDNYEKWLEYINSQSNIKTLPDGLVCASTFFSVRKSDNKIIGIINIRHELNDYLLKYGGHIGYSILPSERGKGYAHKQLSLGLKYCKKLNIDKVLITCVDYNKASARTIEKAGGILENKVFNPIKETLERRYWINNI